MAAYNGLQRTLISRAGEYTKLGFKIAYAKGKAFVAEYKPPPMAIGWYGIAVPTGEPETPDDFDGISLIPEGIACVDLDINDFGVIWMGSLPPTWKERTPRGWHLFYNLPIAEMVHDRKYTTKIKWQPHVDLLVKEPPAPKKKRSAYSRMKEDGSLGDSPWGEHVLISPTPGYERRWPEEKQPNKTELAMAPQWLVDALEKP